MHPTEVDDYFTRKNVGLMVFGGVILVVVIFLVPPTFLPAWRHTVGVALTVLAMGPWALNTIFRRRRWGYVLALVTAIGVMAVIEAMFRQF